VIQPLLNIFILVLVWPFVIWVIIIRSFLLEWSDDNITDDFDGIQSNMARWRLASYSFCVFLILRMLPLWLSVLQVARLMSLKRKIFWGHTWYTVVCYGYILLKPLRICSRARGQGLNSRIVTEPIVCSRARSQGLYSPILSGRMWWMLWYRNRLTAGYDQYVSWWYVMLICWKSNA